MSGPKKSEQGTIDSSRSDTRTDPISTTSTPQSDMLATWTSAALAEYNSLRTEALQASQSQRIVLQFGITGIGLLMSVGLHSDDKLLSLAILLFLEPIIAIIVVVIWIGELTKLARTGAFLTHVEDKINAAIGSSAPALEWEGWMARHPRFRSYTYYRVEFATVMALTAASLALGGYFALSAQAKEDHRIVAIGAIGLASIGFFLTSIWLYRRAAKSIHAQTDEIRFIASSSAYSRA